MHSIEEQLDTAIMLRELEEHDLGRAYLAGEMSWMYQPKEIHHD